MADYFFVLDAADFETRLRPALTAAYRRRSFEPLRPAAAELTAAARLYGERYHAGGDEPLLARLEHGLTFDRLLWRTLVSEILLFTAMEIPEFQTNADALCLLLAPSHYQEQVTERARLAPIQQAHRGSRDLTFGAAVYRPDQAGCNTAADVARLADYLQAVRPDAWTDAELIGLRDVPPEDLADELAFTQEWFPALVDLYRRAQTAGRMIVHESIY
jgi:hypothetical protein